MKARELPQGGALTLRQLREQQRVAQRSHAMVASSASQAKLVGAIIDQPEHGAAHRLAENILEQFDAGCAVLLAERQTAKDLPEILGWMQQPEQPEQPTPRVPLLVAQQVMQQLVSQSLARVVLLGAAL